MKQYIIDKSNRIDILKEEISILLNKKQSNINEIVFNFFYKSYFFINFKDLPECIKNKKEVILFYKKINNLIKNNNLSISFNINQFYFNKLLPLESLNNLKIRNIDIIDYNQIKLDILSYFVVKKIIDNNIVEIIDNKTLAEVLLIYKNSPLIGCKNLMYFHHINLLLKKYLDI